MSPPAVAPRPPDATPRPATRWRAASAEPAEPASWRALLAASAARLGDRQAARWLVEEVAGLASGELLVRLDAAAPAGAAAALAELVARRLGGEPLQHVLGRWSFAGVELKVDRRALVPRPETELLVELAIGELAAPPGGLPAPSTVLDLGTGSGAIALALAAALPSVQVVAVERSPAALALARENRHRLPEAAARRVAIRPGSWYEGLDAGLASAVRLVVSNPPYLAAAEWVTLDPVVRDHDPYEALVAGETGLEAVEAVLAGAPSVLVAGGSVLLEIAPHQAAAALALAGAAGARRARVLHDLAGRPRVLGARW